ncbi:MAG: GFA family protein [Pseudomonadales bacterium]|nr:GFA family protein [Pseudomonadales bacterium]
MIDGKCLCGEITYILKSELLYLYNCHCKECRAFSGSSMATNATISAADFEIYDDNDNLKTFMVAGGKRHFCGNCGSPIYSYPNGSEEFPSLHIGTISNPPEKVLDANSWISEKCPWVKISDSVTSYEKQIE